MWEHEVVDVGVPLCRMDARCACDRRWCTVMRRRSRRGDRTGAAAPSLEAALVDRRARQVAPAAQRQRRRSAALRDPAWTRPGHVWNFVCRYKTLAELKTGRVLCSRNFHGKQTDANGSRTPLFANAGVRTAGW